MTHLQERTKADLIEERLIMVRKIAEQRETINLQNERIKSQGEWRAKAEDKLIEKIVQDSSVTNIVWCSITEEDNCTDDGWYLIDGPNDMHSCRVREGENFIKAASGDDGDIGSRGPYFVAGPFKDGEGKF